MACQDSKKEFIGKWNIIKMEEDDKYDLLKTKMNPKMEFEKDGYGNISSESNKSEKDIFRFKWELSEKNKIKLISVQDNDTIDGVYSFEGYYLNIKGVVKNHFELFVLSKY